MDTTLPLDNVTSILVNHSLPQLALTITPHDLNSQHNLTKSPYDMLL